MALNDKTQRVVLKFNVDAEGVVLGVQRIGDELTKVEKKAKDSSKGLGDFIGGIDSTMEKFKRGYADISSIVSAAVGLARDALEDMRLEAGSAGVSIEGLRKASAGLRTEDQLMADAIKFKSAAFKLSQSDMEDVEGAMRKLTREGKDQDKVYQAITQSLTKLSTEGLQELGIHVEKAGLSMDDAADRSELFKRVMQQLRTESMGVADAELTKQEQLAASGVAFEDAVDQIKGALGNMVVALAPLIKKVAELVAEIAKIPTHVRTGAQGAADDTKKSINALANFFGADSPYFDEDEMQAEDYWNDQGAQFRKMKRLQELAAAGNQQGFIALSNGFAEDQYDEYIKSTTDNDFFGTGGNTAAPVGKGYKGKGKRDAASSAAAAEAKRRADEARRLADEVAKSLTDDLISQLEDEAPDVEDSFIQLGNNLGSMLGALGEKINEGAAALVANENRKTSFLEGAFGKIEDFNRYAAAFNILQSAVTGAMDAWITGSESMGTAVKKAIGAGLKALAADLAIQALKHGAYAIGSLAFGDVRGAGLHGVAAAQFAAGSVAAAVAARAMGHGGTDYGKAAGGGAGGGASAAAPGPRPANSNAQAESKIVYVVGDPFDTEANPRRRQNNAKRLLDEVGMRSSMGGSY